MTVKNLISTLEAKVKEFPELGNYPINILIEEDNLTIDPSKSLELKRVELSNLVCTRLSKTDLDRLEDNMADIISILP